MKQQIKRLLFAIVPRAAATFFAARARAHSQKVLREWGCVAIAEQITKRYGEAVLRGPFRGTKVTKRCLAEHISPYLLGLYEHELNGVWQVVLDGRYTQVLDIGAKFGFYAVGLARVFPATPVVAFDPDPWARQTTLEMAAVNGTPNVVFEAFCDANWLRNRLQPNALIICDCEGYEEQLFGKSSLVALNLNTATLIIETHEGLAPGVECKIRRVMERSHQVFSISSKETTGPPPVDLSFLTAPQRQLATHEVRSPQVWLLCLPNQGVNTRLSWPVHRVAEGRSMTTH